MAAPPASPIVEPLLYEVEAARIVGIPARAPLPYVQSFKGYHYLRFQKQKKVKLEGEFGSAEFVASYRRALADARLWAKDQPRTLSKKSGAPEGPAVYVFGFDHYIKIGFSRDFRKRRTGLQEGLPRALDTYLIIPGGSFETERELHARFSRYRLRGEWFLFAGELAEWIEEQVGILPADHHNIRRAENLPEHRLQAIKNRNKNEWLEEHAPNPWDLALGIGP